MGMHRQRFQQLWLRCASDGASADADIRFDEIASHYRESHRRYHTPEHVEHCLGQFDDARDQMDDPDSVELAVWYHDVIYDAGASDNELMSAELFQRRAAGHVDEERIRTIHDLVMVTVHNRVAPSTEDQGFMVDIDLSSFGLPWDRFLRDSVAVREEFPHLSDEEFYPKQKGFLQSLLQREHFCYTEFFRLRHEERARTNIQRYLDELAGRGLLDPVTPSQC
jgi:predicted metal-dependent HD superfamily phosphohydrolase